MNPPPSPREKKLSRIAKTDLHRLGRAQVPAAVFRRLNDDARNTGACVIRSAHAHENMSAMLWGATSYKRIQNSDYNSERKTNKNSHATFIRAVRLAKFRTQQLAGMVTVCLRRHTAKWHLPHPHKMAAFTYRMCNC